MNKLQVKLVVCCTHTLSQLDKEIICRKEAVHIKGTQRELGNTIQPLKVHKHKTEWAEGNGKLKEQSDLKSDRVFVPLSICNKLLNDVVIYIYKYIHTHMQPVLSLMHQLITPAFTCTWTPVDNSSIYMYMNEISNLPLPFPNLTSVQIFHKNSC